ncbi:hypothetical protein [Kitasatospora sp. NPDC004531]
MLTANHAVGPGPVSVRFWGGQEYSARRVAAGADDVDLAVLELLEEGAPEAPRVRVARVDSTVTAQLPCQGLGYPKWKEGPKRPDSPSRFRGRVQLAGEILTAEGPVGDRLTASLRATPRDHPGTVAGSVWAGSSGTVVFTGRHRREFAIGVVVTHQPADGVRTLTLEPFTAIDRLGADDRRRFRALLGLSENAGLPVLRGVEYGPGVGVRRPRWRTVLVLVTALAAAAVAFLALPLLRPRPATPPVGLGIQHNKGMYTAGDPARITVENLAQDRATVLLLQVSDTNPSSSDCVPGTGLSVRDSAGRPLPVTKRTPVFEVKVPPGAARAMPLTVAVTNKDRNCHLDLDAALG